MCGRYTLGNINLKKRFGIFGETLKIFPSYNISPGTYNPVIIGNPSKDAVLMKWGFIPKWSKDRKFSLINIRKETLEDKPYFNNLLHSNRCLIPADGFYEWKKINLEGKDEKIPFYFHLKDKKLFSFAGLYSKLSDVEGKSIYTYAIITCPANETMKLIHSRMPVILKQKDEDVWLNKNNVLDLLTNLTVPFTGELKTYPVKKEVNSPANDNLQLIEPINVPEK